jgi:hypothetical protein
VSVNVYSYDVLILNLRVSFVNQDMFMRYTHLGVGHPAMLRNITKNCLGLKSLGATVISNKADMDHEGDSDKELYAGCSDAEEDSDEEISDDEMEDENLDKGGGDNDDDDDDLPSF